MLARKVLLEWRIWVFALITLAAVVVYFGQRVVLYEAIAVVVLDDAALDEGARSRKHSVFFIDDAFSHFYSRPSAKFVFRITGQAKRFPTPGALDDAMMAVNDRLVWHTNGSTASSRWRGWISPEMVKPQHVPDDVKQLAQENRVYIVRYFDSDPDRAILLTRGLLQTWLSSAIGSIERSHSRLAEQRKALELLSPPLSREQWENDDFGLTELQRLESLHKSLEATGPFRLVMAPQLSGRPVTGFQRFFGRLRDLKYGR